LDDHHPDTEKPGFFITSDFQTEGKGHGDNHWFSSPGRNILMSFLWSNPQIKATDQFNISRFVSLVLCNYIRKILPQDCDVRIKWPNDLICNNMKIAGILIDHRIAGSFVLSSNIGLGLNVNEEQFPDNLPNAGSLLMITGEKKDLNIVLEGLTEDFQTTRFNPNISNNQIHRLYDENLYLLRREMHFRDQYGCFKGIITGTTQDGRLIIKTASGGRKYGFKEVSYSGF
jgi:BirA family transcriptional regulator, biotin operon repressor / biotin---[acetyl-CoA-carboxylase] ligase